MPRYNVEFSAEVNDALEALAENQGGSKADVIRKAIALEKWFVETGKRGGKIFVEENGQIREVLHV